jgi:hypothetical protein
MFLRSHRSQAYEPFQQSNQALGCRRCRDRLWQGLIPAFSMPGARYISPGMITIADMATAIEGARRCALPGREMCAVNDVMFQFAAELKDEQYADRHQSAR